MTDTAKDLIHSEIINTAAQFDAGINLPIPNGKTPTDYHDELIDDGFEDALYDATEEFRSSGDDTDIESPYSRHYESTQVARVLDGGVVCWTHWYGGGKHSEPSAIGWIDDAYFVNVEQKATVVNVYSKLE